MLPARIAPQVRSASTSPHTSDGEGIKPADVSEACFEAERQRALAEPSSSQELPASEEPYLETLHFFGVFDGHGGAEAALHCAQTLHQHIADALAAATEKPNDADSGEDLAGLLSKASSGVLFDHGTGLYEPFHF